MFPVIPSIDPRLVNLAPGFRALSISVRGAEMIHPEVGAAKDIAAAFRTPEYRAALDKHFAGYARPAYLQ